MRPTETDEYIWFCFSFPLYARGSSFIFYSDFPFFSFIFHHYFLLRILILLIWNTAHSYPFPMSLYDGIVGKWEKHQKYNI